MKRLLVLPVLGAAVLGALGLGLAEARSSGAAAPALSASARLPDLDQELPTDVRIAVGLPGTRPRYRLGFASAVRNAGDGPLIIDGRRSGSGMTADQVVLNAAGGEERVPAIGELQFVQSPDHSHWHYLGFDRYELRRAGGTERLVHDQKTGFCLGDRYQVATRVFPAAPPEKVYRTNCGKNSRGLDQIREGISVGYGDVYKAFLEYQDLPLSGVPAGRYVLVHRVNSDRRLEELSYANDAASLLLDLRWMKGKPTIRVLAQCPDTDRCDRRPQVRTVATGLQVPWDIDFLPGGGALVTERPRRVRRLLSGGQLQAAPVARVAVSAHGEGGLLGLALDPAFGENRFVYLYFTAEGGMKLERWRWTGSQLVWDGTLVDAIEAGTVHDSGRIGFAPDGRLFVATGDAGKPLLAQDAGSLNGKFLALTPEQYRGSATVRPQIVASGLRNPQGFDWQPGTGELIANDHGPSGFDGPPGYDEVNRIVQGGNYGWPRAMSYGTGAGKYIAPLEIYRQAIAPSGAAFVSRPGSAWTGSYLLAALRGQVLRRLEIQDGRVDVDESVLTGYGRLRTVKEGPDGDLYVLTSNRDGRGRPVAADDRILAITPPAP